MNYAIPSILSSPPAAHLPVPEGDVAPTRRHLPALDGLRGLAILLVLGHNMTLVDGPVSGVAAKLVRYLFDWGWVGVQLFFVLSGFLITALLLQEHHDSGGIGFRRFYVRRAIRLFPALLAMLAVYLVYAQRAGWPPFGSRDFVFSSVKATLLYTMNWQVLWHPFAAMVKVDGH